MNPPSHDEYEQEILRLAADAWEESDHDEDRAGEVLREDIDGHQWVIYTFLAEHVSRHISWGEDAEECSIDDDLGAVMRERGFSGLWTTLAFRKMHADASLALYDIVEAWEEAEE